MVSERHISDQLGRHTPTGLILGSSIALLIIRGGLLDRWRGFCRDRVLKLTGMNVGFEFQRVQRLAKLFDSLLTVGS